MNNKDCLYGIRVDKGLDHYLKCSKSNSYCKYQKYCSKRKTAVNTDDYLLCSLLEKEETKMAKTKKVVTPKTEKKVQEGNNTRYTVLIATPNYYILDINGSPTKIFGANNYKKGDSVEI